MPNQQSTYEEMERSLTCALQKMFDETPCPFCGGSVQLDGTAGGVRVGCKECDAWGESGFMTGPAYENWVKYVRAGEDWEKKKRKSAETTQEGKCPFCSSVHIELKE